METIHWKEIEYRLRRDKVEYVIKRPKKIKGEKRGNFTVSFGPSTLYFDLDTKSLIGVFMFKDVWFDFDHIL